MTDLAAIMETFDCRQQFFNGESNVDDVQADVKRGDVDFKRNLLSLKSEVEFDDEINVDNDDVEEEEENVESDDGDSDEYYGECYDGPFQFLSDDYDECDFTPQELQEFMFQQQQQTMYSLRRYSLLETIQEETSDELRMSSVSDESCRSDYSGVWCWGDDYPDDGSESVVVTRQQQHPQQQEDAEPVFDSDLEENPLSDREGSWLDLDDHSLQPDVAVNDDEKSVDATDAVDDDERELLLNSPVNDISPAVRGEGETVTEVSSWSDAIDAYLMSRVTDKAVGRKSCTGSRSLSGNDLSFNSPAQDKRDATVTSEESASSSAEDDSIGSRFCIGVTSRSITRLSGVKSDPNLFQRDVTDDCYVSPPPRYVDDDYTLKKVSNFSSFGNGDVIGWNDDVNKSQSLPCVNMDRCDHQSSNRSVSESQVTPSIASHLDQTDISCSNFGDVSLFVYEDEDIEEEEEEEEEDDFSSDESDDHSTLYRNRSQPLLPFLRFARPASLRSFRSFDTSLNLAGMTEQPDDDFDDVVEEDAEDVGTGSSSSTNLRSTSKSCEDLSEDSGCCDLAVISSKTTNYLQETPEDEEEEEDSGFVTVESSKVEEILDPTSSVSSPTIQLTGSSPSGKKSPEMHEREGGGGIWVGEDDENDQFRVSYPYRNASEESQMCSADVYNSKTSLKNDSHDVTTGLNQVNAIVLQQAIMNNGSGSCNVLPIANADAQNNGGSSIDNLTSFHQSHVTSEFSSPPQQQLGPPEKSSSSSNDEEDEICGVKATNLISNLTLLEPTESTMMSEIRHFNSPLGHVSDGGDDEVDEGFKRCSDSVSGGWVLLCLSSDDVKHGHLQQQQQPNTNLVQHNYRLQSTKQYFEPSKQSVNNCWGEAEESSGASPTRADVTQVGVGAAKNKVGPKNESQQSDCSHNVAEIAADEGETSNVKDDFPIQRREHHQQQRLVIETDALTNANCPVVTALQRNDDNDGGNLVRESVRRDHLLPVSVDKLDRVQSVQVAVEDIAVESSSSSCEDAQVKQSLEPKLDTVGLRSSDELKVTNKSLIHSGQNLCSTNFSDRICVDGVETSPQEEVIENRKISNFQMFMGNRIKGKSKEKSVVFEEKSTICEEKPIIQRDKSSVGDKMEILVEKEKDKKKKVAKKSWWFLPKSKQSEPGTVHVTLPFTSSKAATKEKQSGSSRTNGGEKSSNNGCHGNVSYLDRGDGLRKKEDSDLSELETRLDMETFTNNLWIEFENELKGVWPTAANTNNNHGSSQPKPAVVAASTSATVESAGDAVVDKIMVRENNGTSSSGINQRCRDNGQIINEKKEVTSTTVEKNKNSVESVNHVVKGKPPLPSTSSSAQRNKGKVGLPKIAKKIAVNEENEEVNDPSLVFDKLRQIAKEGRDRAAKSVQDLSEVEETFRDMDQKEIPTGSGKDDEEDDLSSWSSTPFWSRFRDGEMNRSEADATASDRRCWHDSNQSLVGYLETDIDTFHSREVIRVNPQGEACGSYSSSRREIGGSGLNFGSNVKRHRPVKLKTQSMFNLIDGSGETRKIVNENASLLTPEADAEGDEMTSASSSRAKSMEFLLKAENKAAVEAPENRLMRLRTTNAYRNGGESGPVTPETEVGMSRSMSEHEDRVRRSLQKLNLPDWYTNSRVNQNGSSEHLRRDGDERRSLRWEDYRNRSNSSSSVFSGNGSNNRARNAVVISKRVMTPDWRNVRSSRESLVQSPSSPANSSTQLDKTDDSCSHIYYNSGLSRWSSSRLSTNSSRSSSPTSGFNTSSNAYRSSLKNQPYLGWRSSERLAAINQPPTVKQTEKPFYRSAAERLSKGPGYYALRFGVYTCHNNSNGGESDISLV